MMNPIEQEIVSAARQLTDSSPTYIGTKGQDAHDRLKSALAAYDTWRVHLMHNRDVLPDDYRDGVQVIAGPRMTGKTTAAIQWLQESDDRILLVENARLARNHREVHHLDRDMGERIMSWRQASRSWLPRSLVFGIDAAEKLLAPALGVTDKQLALVTITEDLRL